MTLFYTTDTSSGSLLKGSVCVIQYLDRMGGVALSSKTNQGIMCSISNGSRVVFALFR